MLTKTTAWLDHPALQPGGALAAEKRGALGPFDVVPGRLVAGESGVHHFVLSGSPGVTLQAKVTTEVFEPIVAVIGPSGVRWDLSRVARASDAGGGSWPELALHEAGDYVIVVTSRENLTASRAVTTGEYRLTLLCDAPRKAPTVPPTSVATVPRPFKVVRPVADPATTPRAAPVAAPSKTPLAPPAEAPRAPSTAPRAPAPAAPPPTAAAAPAPTQKVQAKPPPRSRSGRFGAWESEPP